MIILSRKLFLQTFFRTPVILKHRNGKIGSRTYFDYVPKYNLYKEGEPDKNLMSTMQLALLESEDSTPEELIESKIVRRRIIS